MNKLNLAAAALTLAGAFAQAHAAGGKPATVDTTFKQCKELAKTGPVTTYTKGASVSNDNVGCMGTIVGGKFIVSDSYDLNTAKGSRDFAKAVTDAGQVKGTANVASAQTQAGSSHECNRLQEAAQKHPKITAGVGAVLGSILGRKLTRNSTVGTAVGAGAGAVTGVAVSNSHCTP